MTLVDFRVVNSEFGRMRAKAAKALSHNLLGNN